MAILTNERPGSVKKIARLISYYLARYSGCEDPIRFFKQSFQIEKFRVETLNTSQTNFWRLKKAGDLPVPIVIGRRNFYTIEAIAEWLAKKQGKSAQEING